MYSTLESSSYFLDTERCQAGKRSHHPQTKEGTLCQNGMSALTIRWTPYLARDRGMVSIYDPEILVGPELIILDLGEDFS